MENNEKKPGKKPEATVVTTLTVTHILPDCTADEAVRFAEIIAETAQEALTAGYAEGVLPQGRPDNIGVSAVQVFGIDGDSGDSGEANG